MSFVMDEVREKLIKSPADRIFRLKILKALYKCICWMLQVDHKYAINEFSYSF